MALVVADRVQETTNTTGTGTLTLAGAVSGYQSFAAIGNGNTTYYTIVSGTDWEVGLGTYTSVGTTLARTTILRSSAAGAAISVAAGATIFGNYPADKAVYEDASGAIAIAEALSYTDTGIIGSFASTTAGYNQLVLQNKSANAAASANLNISNDSATSSTNFGEFGINSSTFTGSGAFNTAGMVYLASASTDIAIGTYGSNAIHFVVNSGATDAATISTAGLLTANNFASSSVAITGGTINTANIGATTAGTGRFSTLAATGVFTASAGTAALPSIVTASGSTTGFYSSTANVLGISVSAASVGTIDSGGVQGLNIGATTAGTGRFTTLTATGAVTLSPASAAVALSPTGTGTVAISPAGALTVNPTAASTINNCSIGVTTNAAGRFTTLAATTSVLLTSTSGGVGYATGSGSTGTQATSRTTGVTVSRPTGAITLFSTTTTAGQTTTFTVTNTTVAATDTIILNQKSGTGIYFLSVSAVAAGSFNISVYTPAAVGTAEAPVINFAVIKAVAA